MTGTANGRASGGISPVFEASCAFDAMAVDLTAVGSMAALMASSDNLGPCERSAFLGLANAIDGLAGQANAHSDLFLQHSREKQGLA